MDFLQRIVGEWHWTRPLWIQRLGMRRLLVAVGTIAALALIAYGVRIYLLSLPQPPQVVAQVTAPALTPIVDGKLVPEPLFVDFAVVADPRAPVITQESVARLDLIGKSLSEGIHLKPALPGQWQWETETRLRFQPAADWPAGQNYAVRYEPAIFAPGLQFAETSAAFTTPPFQAQVDELLFYQDPAQRDVRKVVGTLSFTHPVDAGSLERQLQYLMRESGDQAGSQPQVVQYTLDYDAHHRKAYVHSTPIAIPPHETYLTLHLQRGLAPSTGPSRFEEELLQNVRIPEIGTYFRVESLQSLITRNDKDEPLQTLTFEFTDRVAESALQSKLTAWLLPMDLTLDGRRLRNKHWSGPREITREVLNQAQPVTLTLNAVEGGIAQFHSANVDLPENRYLYVQIEQGLQSDGDFVMSKAYDSVVQLPEYPREATIAQDGAILPLAGSHKLTFVSRGVTTLKVEIGRLLPGDVNHLATQSGGDIKSPYFHNYSFNADNLTERSTRLIDVNPTHPRAAVYSSLDLSTLLQEGGYFFINVQGWDRQNDYAVGSADQRFVMITDIGMLVKANADQSQDVFLHSINGRSPIAGAEVQLLGKNGLPIASGKTSPDGHLQIAPVDQYQREKEPAVFVARLGGDTIFMPYARSTRMLQYSRFDIGGDYVQQHTDAQRLQAQLFTDRGLYRPGERAQLAAIVKRDDWAPLTDLPLLLNVSDPRGQTVLERQIRLPAGGLFDAAFDSNAASPTGSYNVTLYLVEKQDQRRAIGSTSFKIEEFQPDRLRIRSSIKGQTGRGWLRPAGLVAEVSLQNLFGLPAQQRRVTGELELTPTVMRLSAFADFAFIDPFRQPASTLAPHRQPLPETRTDTAGLAQLPLDLQRYDNGIYRLTIYNEGFEEGDGRSVRAQASAIVSPLEHMVGFKTASELSFLTQDSAHTIRFIAVNQDAEAIPLDQLRLAIIEKRFVSSLVRRPNGTYAYQSVVKEMPVAEQAFALGAGGTDVPVPTNRAGQFAVRIVNAEGLVLSSADFNVAGAQNLAGNLERNAELQLTLNGSSFEPGSEIEMQITAPYAGSGLITIERDRVYAYQWFSTDTSSSVARIRVPDDLEGNAYVNVAFVRAPDSPEIFVNPLSYAVQPFAIDKAARTVAIELVAPERIQPGEELVISYRASRPARMILYAVDEGILQVARYEQPRPLDHFLRKMALQVSTFQLVDLLLPDFEAYANNAAPGGGDAALQRALAGNLNPFGRKSEAPVAFWSGVIEAGTDTRTLTFPVPDHFNGQLRVMAVAAGETTLGSATTSTIVRGPFVLTPNVLTAAAPGDEFEITVGVSNGLQGSGNAVPVEIAVTPSAQLEIIGDATQTLTLDEGSEGRVSFRIRARDVLGGASLHFAARSGAAAVGRTATLSVRPSVPRVVTVETSSSADDPLRASFPRTLFDAFSAQSVAASASPLILTDGLLDYLDAFPHACAEQIVSKVFPQIGFLGRGDTTLDESKIRTAFDETVFKLRARQTPNGGFQFWASSSEPADFPSVYIMHFLTDAQALGLTVPRDLREHGLGYLRDLAAREVTSLWDARVRAYAIYVLTRNETVTTNYLTNLHEYLDRTHADQWQQDLTAVYMAASYQLLKQVELSNRVIGHYELGSGDELTHDFDTRLGRDAQYIYVLARHFPKRLGAIGAEQIRAMVAPILRNRFNTLSSAYTILALAAYSEAQEQRPGGLPLEIAATVNGQIQLLAQASRFARATVGTAAEGIEIRGSRGNDIYSVTAQTGFDREPPQDPQAEGLELFREYLDASGNVVNQANIGDDLTVRLRVRAIDRPRSNIALIDMLPGGFEVQTESIRDQYDDWYADYRDVREDRVVIYGSFGERVTEIRYRIKVTSAGSFVVPSAYAGSMYDRSIQARTKPGRFLVSAAQ